MSDVIAVTPKSLTPPHGVGSLKSSCRTRIKGPLRGLNPEPQILNLDMGSRTSGRSTSIDDSLLMVHDSVLKLFILSYDPSTTIDFNFFHRRLLSLELLRCKVDLVHRVHVFLNSSVVNRIELFSN